LLELLEDLKTASIKGYWQTTYNEVSLFVSRLGIESNYSYFYCEDFKTSRVQFFGKSEIHCDSLKLIEDFRKWTVLKQRTSTLISKASETNRLAFFNKQLNFIETL
jgi:hypothetical protein